MLRIIRSIVELFAAIAGILVIVAFLLAWRLTANPVNWHFLTPYIATGIENIIPDSHVEVKDTELSWGGPEHLIVLHADGISVTAADGALIALLPTFDAKITPLGLLFGQFIPTDLSIDHPQFNLLRQAGGTVMLGNMQMGMNMPEQPMEPMSATVTTALDRLSHALLMNHLAVTRAIFNVHDQATATDWAIRAPEISIAREKWHYADHLWRHGALIGQASVEVAQQDGLATVFLSYQYDPLLRRHHFSTVIDGLTPALIAGGHPETLGLGAAAIFDMPVSGQAEATFDQTFAMQKLALRAHGDAGHLIDADLWDQPRPVKALDLALEYDRVAQQLKIHDTRIDFDGPTVTVDAVGEPPRDKSQDLDFTATATLDDLPMNQFAALAPKTLIPHPREWIATNMRNGLFRHAEAFVSGGFNWHDPAHAAIRSAHGVINAENAQVTYVAAMPPVENVSAVADFDLNAMRIKLTGGGIGAIRILPSALVIKGLSDDDQTIDIPLQVSGPTPDILRLLDHQPLRYTQKLGLSPQDLQGTLSGRVDFQFPLLKDLQTRDITINATVTAIDLASATLLPGINLDHGQLALALDRDGLNIKGLVQIQKTPFHIEWQDYFHARANQPLRKIIVQGVVDDTQWRNFGVSLFGNIKGASMLSLTIVKPDKNRTFYNGHLDMRAASFNVPLLNWRKPANAAAGVSFTAVAQAHKPVDVKNISLRGPQLAVDGAMTLSPDLAHILSFDAPRFVVGRSDAALTIRNQDGLTLTASGTALDVSGLSSDQSSDRAASRSQEFHLALDHLYTGADGRLDQVKGMARRDQQGWTELDLRARAQGRGDLEVNLTPQPDGTAVFSARSDDFGATMQGLGLTDTVKGGVLNIQGHSAANNRRAIAGTIKIGDFSVENLPVLALLLNATSPFGFADILTDRASFSMFRGDFVWQGDTIDVTRAHASGSAIGINLDGRIDLHHGEANLHGTLVPFSSINKVLSYIPLFGDLITGGEDQGVLAVSYRLMGPLSAPQLMVQPVSLLTPGFVRNIFFNQDPHEDEQ